MSHDAAMSLLQDVGKQQFAFSFGGWVYSSMRKISSLHLLLKYEVKKGTRLPIITYLLETAVSTMAQ